MNKMVFPFGSEVKPVIQKDRKPKKVFVLGVYASAVHAKWVDPENRILCRALAVASEPEIFWQGDLVQTLQILKTIPMPPGSGMLIPALEEFNGPSGRSLDTYFLEPLGLKRDQVWLCDLVPYACQNDNQAKAVRRVYEPRRADLGLPAVVMEPHPQGNYLGDARVEAIFSELLESQAEMVITLGDDPIKHFLNRVSSIKLPRLGEMDSYGQVRPLQIRGKNLSWLPLVHPRQAGRLGKNNAKWELRHLEWLEKAKQPPWSL